MTPRERLAFSTGGSISIQPDEHGRYGHRFGDCPRLEVYVEGQPVSVNHMYGSTRHQARFLTEPAKAWRDAAEAETAYARLASGEVTSAALMGPAPYRTPLKVVCIFYGSRADADNLLKLTLDGLKFSLGIDDGHFAVVESGKAPVFTRNGRRFRGCWIGVWESVAAASASEAQGGAA